MRGSRPRRQARSLGRRGGGAERLDRRARPAKRAQPACGGLHPGGVQPWAEGQRETHAWVAPGELSAVGWRQRRLHRDGRTPPSWADRAPARRGRAAGEQGEPRRAGGARAGRAPPREYIGRPRRPTRQVRTEGKKDDLSHHPSSTTRMPARPLHTQCVSRYLSILHCSTISERRDRVQRFTNDSHRQPASRYSRFIAPFFCGGNVHPLSYNMRKFRGRWCNTQSSATIFLSVLKGEIHL